MAGELIINLSAMVALCVISTFLQERWPLGRSPSQWVQGILFGGISVLSMAYSVSHTSGYVFDGRSVVLCLAAWHFGWPAALASCLMAVLYRLGMGGPGALAGSVVILASSGFGLGMRQNINPEREDPSLLDIVRLGIGVHLLIGFIITVMMESANRAMFLSGNAPFLLTAYPLATILGARILGDFQARVRAEAKVAVNERLVEGLLGDSPLMTLILDATTGQILQANRPALEFYGYEETELLKKTYQDLVDPEPAGMAAKIFAEGSPGTTFLHQRHRLANGRIREVDTCSGQVWFRGHSVEIRFVMDITERMESLRNIENTLKEKVNILETAMDGFWITDHTHLIREVNTAYCKLTGYMPEEVLGHNLHEFDCYGVNETHLEEIRNTGVIRFDTRHRAKDGSLLDLEVSVRSAPGPRGEQYYTFFRDVTEEKAMRQHRKLLSESLAATANAVIITDAQQRIEWVNQAFTRNSGYSWDEALGLTPGELVKSGEHPPEYYRSMNETLDAGNLWQGELTNRKKDGTLYTVEATITPMKNEEGDVTHYVGINQDITRRKDLEALYLRSQRLESVGRLTSGIAHDLNNILSPILMSAEMLSKTLPSGQEKEMADLIASSAARGGNLLHQLLDFARGTKGKRQALTLGPLLKETHKLYRETLSRTIMIELEVDPGLPLVYADPGQVSQVLNNLIVNARDAMPEGGRLLLSATPVTVTEETARKSPLASVGDFVRIRVEDSGSGIDPDLIDVIFDPFFSTKPQGKGTGLGLSTCLGILKGHGGFILLNSESGKGTRVDAYFPVLPAEDPLPDLNPPGPAASFSLAGKRVLVVDDEEAIRLIVRTFLESKGAEVQECGDGQEALDVLMAPGGFDMLLIDLSMPEMDGSRVIDKLKRNGITLPTLLITGYRAGEAVDPDQLGNIPILYKPFAMADLQQEVENLLQGHSA